MADTVHEHQPTVGDLLEWVVRRWPIVLAAFLVGGLGGWGVAQMQSATYTSTTLVQVTPVDPDATGAGLNLDTEAQVVRSVDTAARVGEGLALAQEPTALAERVTVTVPANTTFLEISFDAGSPEQAQEGARAFAEEYLRQREESAQREIDDRIARLDEQIRSLRAQGADEDVIVPLLNEQLLLDSESVSGGEVRSPASLPSSPSAPNVLLFTVSGLVAGLLLGLSMALLVHRLDNRVFRVRDLPDDLADQVLTELRGQRPGTQVVGPGTASGRQFSRLRNVMRASADAASPTSGASGVLLLCGISQGTGAGFVTANLAAAFARAGERVVVLGCDPESPTFEALELPPAEGCSLGALASGAVSASEAVVASPTVPRVSVLRLAPGEDMRELPAGEVMGVVLRLATSADRVIIEAPPMARSIDAQALSVTASALLLVVEHQRTRVPEVAAAVRDFGQVHAPLAGLLLVPPAGRRGRPAPLPPMARPGAAPAAPAPPYGAPGGAGPQSTGVRPQGIGAGPQSPGGAPAPAPAPAAGGGEGATATTQIRAVPSFVDPPSAPGAPSTPSPETAPAGPEIAPAQAAPASPSPSPRPVLPEQSGSATPPADDTVVFDRYRGDAGTS